MAAAQGHIERRADDEIAEVLFQPEPTGRRQIGLGGDEAIAHAKPREGFEEADAVASHVVDGLKYGGKAAIPDVLHEGGSSRLEIVVGRAALAVRGARIGGDAIGKRRLRLLHSLIAAFPRLARPVGTDLHLESQRGRIGDALCGEGPENGGRHRARIGAARVN